MKHKKSKNWKEKLHEIIYEADTFEGKLFDIILLILIAISIILVMLESVKEIDAKYHDVFYLGEWIITIFFTIEYFARIISIKKPSKYIFSFYGIIDFLSTIPLYLSLFIAGTQTLIILRSLRLLRVFKILKISSYVGESNSLMRALKNSRIKIFVFLFAVIIIAIIFGTLMYLIEGEKSGFNNIPISIYWSIVTLTTVGYGDIHPTTSFGQFIASVLMILGYGIIAVPTGIVTSEMKNSKKKKIALNSQVCENCHFSDHKDEAKYCYNCGEILD